jgi:hypothetical protein
VIEEPPVIDPSPAEPFAVDVEQAPVAEEGAVAPETTSESPVTDLGSGTEAADLGDD